jgi:hypothetical protein
MSETNPAIDSCAGPPNPPEIEALYPEDSQPQDARDIASTICAHGYSPLLVNAVLLDLVKSHLADPGVLMSPLLRQVFKNGGYIEENEDGSGPKSPILIQTLDRWKLTDHEARPAVLVKDGQWTQQPMGQGLFSTDYADGSQKYVTIWQGSAVVFVLSHTPGLAKLLAGELVKLFTFLGPRIKSELQFDFFGVLNYGPCSRAVEAAPNFVVPIDIGFIVEEAWEISIDAAPLKRVVFTLRDVLGP